MAVTLNIYASRFGTLGKIAVLIGMTPPTRTSAQWRMVNSLLLATFIRTLLVIVSYGCKVPCGIFVPSMAIGATFGRMVGILVKALYQFVVFLCYSHQFNLFEGDRAYPISGMFYVCQPDAPCITPGTYAFLGAAAALRYVIAGTFWSMPDNVARAAASCVSLSRSWSSCSSSLAL